MGGPVAVKGLECSVSANSAPGLPADRTRSSVGMGRPASHRYRDRMSARRQIKLGMFLRPAGHHVAGWRRPEAWADGGLDFRKYVEMARTAERGLFDLMFSADALTGERYGRETLSRTSYVAWIEPMSLLTALAPVTEHIGLVCAATTTYDEPYHIALRFASLHPITAGRSPCNLV